MPQRRWQTLHCNIVFRATALMLSFCKNTVLFYRHNCVWRNVPLWIDPTLYMCLSVSWIKSNFFLLQSKNFTRRLNSMKRVFVSKWATFILLTNKEKLFCTWYTKNIQNLIEQSKETKIITTTTNNYLLVHTQILYKIFIHNFLLISSTEKIVTKGGKAKAKFAQ